MRKKILENPVISLEEHKEKSSIYVSFTTTMEGKSNQISQIFLANNGYAKRRCPGFESRARITDDTFKVPRDEEKTLLTVPNKELTFSYLPQREKIYVEGCTAIIPEIFDLVAEGKAALVLDCWDYAKRGSKNRTPVHAIFGTNANKFRVEPSEGTTGESIAFRMMDALERSIKGYLILLNEDHNPWSFQRVAYCYNHFGVNIAYSHLPKNVLYFLDNVFRQHEVKHIVDVGAGAGFWSKILQLVGFNVTPVDINPPKKTFTEVYKVSGEKEVKKCGSDDAIMLVWPLMDKEVLAKILANFSGKLIVHVGNNNGHFTKTKGLEQYGFVLVDWVKYPILWPSEIGAGEEAKVSVYLRRK